MVGGVLRHVRAAAARHGRDGRHAAGDGAHHRASCAATTGGPSPALYASNTFGAVRRRARRRVLAGPRARASRAPRQSCIALNLLCGVAALALFPATRGARADAAPSRRPRRRARGVLSGSRSPACWGSATRCSSSACSARSPKTPSTPSRCCSRSTSSAAPPAPPATSAGSSRAAIATLARRPLLAALAAACLVGHGVAVGRRAREGVGAARARRRHGARPSPPRRCSRSSRSGRRRSSWARCSATSAVARRAAGVSFGRALGVNTLGAAAAPALFGVLAVPALGPKLALLLIGLGYLALTARRAWSQRPSSWAPAGGRAGAGAVRAAARVHRRPRRRPRRQLPRRRRWPPVSVVEDADGVARLRINNRQQEGSSATLRVDARQAWLPLLLHPAPAARAVPRPRHRRHRRRRRPRIPTLQVDAVELLPEVIDGVGALHARASRDAAGSRLHVMAADARRYVRASDRALRRDRLGQLPSGAQRIGFAVHRRALRGRAPPARRRAACSASGCRCTSSISTPCAASCGRSWRRIRRAGRCSRATAWRRRCSGWSGARDAAGSTSPPSAIAWRASRCPSALASLGLEDELAVLGSFVAGPEALRRFAGDAAANTDDRPVVAYRAPRITYAPDSPPRDRLIALLRELSIERRDRADRSPRPTRPGRAAWPPTGWRATASSSRAATCGPSPRVAGHAGAGARAAALRAAHQPGLSPGVRSAAGDGDGAGAIGRRRRAHAAHRADADPAGARRGDRALLASIVDPADADPRNSSVALPEVGGRFRFPETSRDGRRASHPAIRKTSVIFACRRLYAERSRWPASCSSGARLERGCGRTSFQNAPFWRQSDDADLRQNDDLALALCSYTFVTGCGEQ